MSKVRTHGWLGVMVLVAQMLGVNGCEDDSVGARDGAVGKVDTFAVADHSIGGQDGGQDSTGGHDGGHDSTADQTKSCSCPTNDVRRCTALGVQTCTAGQWVTAETCTGGEVCVVDDCVSLGAGCPSFLPSYGIVSVVVESFAPVQTSSCLSGGTSGLAATYVDASSESHPRSLELQFPGNPTCSASQARSLLDFNALFGVQVDAQVNSAEGSGTVTTQVPAGQYGQFYRQTSKVHRVMKLQRDGKTFGIAVLTDWVYTVALAVGATCPVATTLPGAAVFPHSCLSFSESCACP